MDSEARSNHVQQTLRRCAAELHHTGLLRHLAAEMIVRPHALSHWIRKGHVPRLKAEWLEQRFPGIACAETLVRPAKEQAS